MTRVNIGCGQTPIPGWHNYDNSLSLRIARLPFAKRLLLFLGLVQPAQQRYIKFCKSGQIKFADATRSIPEPSDSVDALYSSHMLEHLSKDEANKFLKEAWRILKKGGIIRIAVPDLKIFVERYISDKNAEKFVSCLHMFDKNPDTFSERLRFLIAGFRGHKWMYDGQSLINLLERAGFVDARVMPAGITGIIDPGPLDLHERADESVYIEAVKP